MQALMRRVAVTAAAVAALGVSGCAVSTPPASSNADEAFMQPAERKAALESQAYGIRTKIIQLKQQVVVQEVMLTNVERKAAMSQIALSNLPNTEILSEPAPAMAAAAPVRPEANRLSVAVRPAAAAAPVPSPVAKKKNTKKPLKKTTKPAPPRP